MSKSWGGLNPALTAWRTAINALFPGRSVTSDGGYADDAHGGTSQHQPDADGTVDAFDMDNNLLSSSEPGGSDDERELLEALKLDFEADARAHLWISHREIAQHDTDPSWQERYYGGASPHTEHTHWESHSHNESDGRAWKLPHTEALIQERFDMQLSDQFEMSDDACEALDKPLKTKTTVEGAFELILIHAGRESREHYTATSARLDAIEAKLDAIIAAAG